MTYEYQTTGTCAKLIQLDISDDGIVNEVRFVGGCPGNTVGVAQLVKGMKVDEVISRLEGIKCGMKPTSCPDQLTQALRQIKQAN